ncbi:MAG: ImmA/IrrE family metallo-endopeptidase [Acidobacteriia bacterium]|nr:ImmA/IrrE family metallo-endopeptidase [Terriglobia bacterium]
MKRGFKTLAERIATEMREELDLSDDARLEPLELAEHLAIPVLSLRQVSRAAPKNLFSQYFAVTDPDSFSAITIFRGYNRVIVHNENHHPNRQASNLAHEVSHSLLEHEPTPVANKNGQRYWNAQVEEEATWLGAALLVPRAGALSMVKSDWTVQDIAVHYGVSESLCRWRIGQTGIAYQVQSVVRHN